MKRRHPIYWLRTKLNRGRGTMPHVVRFFLSQRRWGRRLLGGHWEQWWIGSPVNSAMWLDMDHCVHHGGQRPGLGEQLYQCETWTPAHALTDGSLAARTGSGRYRVITSPEGGGDGARLVGLEKLDKD